MANLMHTLCLKVATGAAVSADLCPGIHCTLVRRSLTMLERHSLTMLVRRCSYHVGEMFTYHVGETFTYHVGETLQLPCW